MYKIFKYRTCVTLGPFIWETEKDYPKKALKARERDARKYLEKIIAPRHVAVKQVQRWLSGC